MEISKTDRARAVIAVVSTAAGITLSYELKLYEIALPKHQLAIRVVFVFASIFAGLLISGILIRMILHSKIIRKLLLGSDYLEGYWLLTTRPCSRSKEQKSSFLISHVKYSLPEMRPQVTIYQAKGIRSQEERHSRSQVVICTDDASCYLNYSISTDGDSTYANLAIGSFSTLRGGRCPDTYYGRLFLLDKNQVFTQNGRRLLSKEVRKLKLEHGQDWITVFLQNEFEKTSNSQNQENCTQ